MKNLIAYVVTDSNNKIVWRCNARNHEHATLKADAFGIPIVSPHLLMSYQDYLDECRLVREQMADIRNPDATGATFCFGL